MDEYNAKPKVDVVVDVHDVFEPGLGFDGTRGDRQVLLDQRGDNHGTEFLLEKPTYLTEHGDDVDGDYSSDDVDDGAPRARFERVADVDVSLNGQRHRQPYRGRVEYYRDVLR